MEITGLKRQIFSDALRIRTVVILRFKLGGAK